MTERRSLYKDNNFIADNLNTIICDDSINIMRKLPKRSVFTVTDPPYGINENYKRQAARGVPGQDNFSKAMSKVVESGVEFDKKDWDWDKKKAAPEYILEIIRASKKIVMFGGQNYADLLPANYGWIIWDKENGGTPFSDCELAYTSFLTACRMIKYRWNGMLQENMAQKEARYHPTQKPVAVMTWIIENFTEPDDIIFDPFAGAGSTLVAAKALGRGFIGVEQNETYVSRAKQRLSQGVLFASG